MKIIQKAYAKLNFNLHILPELLPNGYHQIKSVNTEANLFDILTLEEINKGIILTCSDLTLAVDETNLAYKSAKLIIDKYCPQKGIKIHIEKHIPIAGGLGGGSADAATVILALNKLWKLKLSPSQKIDLAKTLGMDVCYCVIGGTCLVSGAGEIVEPLNILMPKLNLIIISPKTQKLSTAWAYKLLDSVTVGQHLDKLDKLVTAIKQKNIQAIADNLHNDFEEVIFQKNPEVANIKAKMLQNNALGVILAGSGMSVFGIWEDQKSTTKAFQKLQKTYSQIYKTVTI